MGTFPIGAVRPVVIPSRRNRRFPPVVRPHYDCPLIPTTSPWSRPCFVTPAGIPSGMKAACHGWATERRRGGRDLRPGVRSCFPPWPACPAYFVASFERRSEEQVAHELAWNGCELIKSPDRNELLRRRRVRGQRRRFSSRSVSSPASGSGLSMATIAEASMNITYRPTFHRCTSSCRNSDRRDRSPVPLRAPSPNAREWA